MTLTEQDLAHVLHRVVPDAPFMPNRAAAARRRAHRTRRRRASAGAILLAAGVTLVATMPAVLSERHSAPTQLAGGAPPLAAGVAAPGDCQTTSGCPTGTIPGALRRPLTLPSLSAGQPCPVSAARQFPAGGGFSEPFSANGEGPVYLVGGPTVSFDYPSAANSAYAADTSWGSSKVLWTIDAAYSGPLLIRGARVDGPEALRFDHYLGAVGYAGEGPAGSTAYPDLAYPENGAGSQSGPGFRTYPSGMWLQAPGCYAIQVDGTSFSTHIIVQAARS